MKAPPFKGLAKGFLAAVCAHLLSDRPCAFGRAEVYGRAPRRQLFWRTPGASTYGALRVLDFTLNGRQSRIALNHHEVDMALGVRRRLGFGRDARIACADYPHLELTVLPAELLRFAPWVAGVVRARERGSEQPAPPVPLTEEWAHFGARCVYAWSHPAWKAYLANEVRWGRMTPEDAAADEWRPHA